jgi:inosine-uridine nucleoside N-ribohydrolase
MKGILLVLPLSVMAMGAQAAPVPVILDTDLGDDIDDTWALLMLLGSPQVDVKLVVTATHDTDVKTRLVAKILERIGRTDIPIGTGVKTADRPINQAKWLGDYSLTDYPGTVYKDGVQAEIDVIKGSSEPITLVVIGPETNLRAALERDPSIAESARVVSMAGSVHIGYNGKEGRSPEWNVRCDVEACRAVLAAPWQVTMAPLDICGTLRLSGERYARVVQAETPRATTLIENYDLWANRHRHPEGSSSVLFDTVAAYLAFDESLCEIETVKLSVDDEGNTVPDENGWPVRCALRWKDRDAFEELLVQALVTEPGGGRGE